MNFEFDLKKSILNKKKHGVDFEEAQTLWLDPYYLEIPAKSEEEERFLVIGKIQKNVWSAFITYRKSAVRIISVRRARKNEVEFYESI
jgi:uncharacterized DUF497 family protein